ncbi:protein ndvB [Paracoccus sediminis]|uniref:Cyclic beta-1,2-glucan synthase n=1 Tax=Paracoccus sediminis TaxID=1214787 RepID=A0A238UVL1_9RHOB|nr:glucoamylase family protein [Paracoccus sediminis]TBN52734.1 protein ndvB [Paracoccus sediminis]SNR26300.1 cyclic beta-1,2-glucan synthase [Paracoccus sediminis]
MTFSPLRFRRPFLSGDALPDDRAGDRPDTRRWAELPRPIRHETWLDRSPAQAGSDLGAAPAPALPAWHPFAFPDRLNDNRAAVRATYLSILNEVRDKVAVTPAAEWLLDNHHVVDETFRHLRRDMAPRVYRNLPSLRLAGGERVPRVLALAWTHVALTNSAVTLDGLSQTVGGMQRHLDLTIGEVWAVPSLLRFVLLENLRRLSDRIEDGRRKRAAANALADRLMAGTAAQAAAALAPEAASARDATFAAQLLYRLRDGSGAATAALDWLEARLAEAGQNPDSVLAAEHARQSSGNVTVGNIIRSLRLIDEIDWLKWFETVSAVDRELRRAPDYAALDDPTRNAYREQIERLARRSELTEVEVARAALADSDGADPGRVLMAEGLADLESRIGYRPTPTERLRRGVRRAGWPMLAGPVAALTAALAVLMVQGLDAPAWVAALLFVLALFPASEAALAVIQIAASRLFPPRRLPAYDFSAGVPETARTLVVIPCLLSSRDDMDELLRTLELHYLANPSGAVDFALLSDWADHGAETRPDDALLLAHARDGIEALAARYAVTSRRFYLLHRHRIHNPQEGVWMGWERKRGKLAELNALLRGDADTSFLDTGPRPPAGVRFVLTLDSDTRLLRGTVAALAGKLAHPVNRPVADADGRVVAGHAILQPRVTPSLTAGDEASVFQRIFSANRGLDPYVFTVSDLYQDMFGQGSFTGKGLYDVDAFARATEGRIPENTVLSHDLFEGALARAALVTDVQVIEDFPVRYHVDAARQHRWIRGDWQLLPFVTARGNGLDGLARFRMIDNLRRSLLPAAWILASVAGWLALAPGAALRWQALLVLALFLGPAIGFYSGLVPGHPSVSPRRHLRVLLAEAGEALSAILLRLCFMPHQAALALDAIGRTLHRMRVSRRHLLEWRSNSEVAAGGTTSRADYLRQMAAAPAVAVVALLLVALVNPANLPLAALMALIWGGAPLVAWETSRTLETQDRLDIAPADAAALRRTARITWRFFEEFVGAETHHLPPDNFQDSPVPKVAERTSPSNVGLYLLATLSARDFGWIGLPETLDRIEATLATLERMDKLNGHLFNWYDTRDLSVLQPHYVSSVDSGNLAGHLVALAAALRGWAHGAIVHVPTNPQGIGDVLDVLGRQLQAVPDDRRALRPLRRRVQERIEGFAQSYAKILAEPQLAAVRGLNLAVIASDILQFAEAYVAEIDGDGSDLLWWAEALQRVCEAAIRPPGNAPKVQERIAALSERARALAFGMDFGFLMNPQRRLLSIGYRADTGQLDESCYDLLASEARLSSLFAIAKGDAPNEHWFRLGRPVAALGTRGALLSWSGSMFEYLMPPLVMHERQGSLLAQSCAAAVDVQIAHGRARGVPWGVSESAFNARDRDMNYQYYAFGVPALALKRSGTDDLVVAPYATALASQIRPRAAVANLDRMEAIGALGRHGFFDAIDFTPARLPDGADMAVVRNVMAHHQGMTIVAIANAVLEGIHRDRFHDDPVIRAAELLLQEKAPREIVPITRSAPGRGLSGSDAELAPAPQTVVENPGQAKRAISVLSNGRYTRMVTATGTGWSRLGDRAVTRWRPDPTLDRDGLFLFLRDAETQDWWSATTAPKSAPFEEARAIFSDHKAEFLKTAYGIESHLDMIVASEAQAEGMRLTLRNRSTRPRVIEVTSFGEIVLDRPQADLAHPAFSKMFVHTAISRDASTITARRNRRGTEPALHLAHLAVGGTPLGAETDRRAFVGRGRDISRPAAMDSGARLEGGQGFTLDPIVALRRRVRIAPGKNATLTFWTIVADDRASLDTALNHYADRATYDHESQLAWTRSQVQLRHMDSSLDEAAVFRAYAAQLIWPDGRMGVQDPDIREAVGPQSGLWGLGISGDLPIMVLRIDTETDLPIVRKALRMQDYFRHHGVQADLVILNDRASSYIQDLQNALNALCETFVRAGHPDPAARHVFVLRQDQMAPATLRALLAVARVVLHSRNGKLSEQLARIETAPAAPQAPAALALPAPSGVAQPPLPDFPAEDLRHFNGYGGFSADGREYVIRLRHGESTPHPWINVIARDGFGFHVSGEGGGFTWAVNSRDYQITPWSNDAVEDRPGEAVLIRCRRTGRLASPFAAVCADPGAIHETRHGLGFSRFRSWSGWVNLDAVQVLAADGPAKLTRMRVTNTGDDRLDLDCLAYAELVLGNDRGRTAPMIRACADGNALTARNPWSVEFPGRAAGLACDRPATGHLASRAAVLGQGDLRRPEALAGAWPGSSTDTGGDPCLALRTSLALAPGETAEVVFALADAPDAELPDLLRRVTDSAEVTRALDGAAAEWGGFLDTLRVQTPDPKLDLMVNTWLPYQALACRIRARSAFYQASGAFGFRDQLQDTSALILHDPDLCRRQILNAAARQFPEGDVQHWWLPASGAGVRTTISDDVVWLGHITERYVRLTGDRGVLDEPVPFIHGPALEPGQHDNFLTPERSSEVAPLYEHCARALDLAVARTGAHGLPLIGGGDWNDGMNRVGEDGRGESVWLGWFLCATLDVFAPLAQARGDNARAAAWQAHRDAVAQALDRAGWDGAWYRRGYYDDGTPLGSAGSEECRIDSIAQSWAAISGAGRPDRVGRAVDSALTWLVDDDAQALKLFTPPFEKTDKEPGYIKAYPPGVRENGGQYTHAASWMVYALGRMGRGTDAHRLFDLLNPISHAENRADADRYRVEPYVVAADVYAEGAKAGRGGWTWYTGSAGWLYRAAVEGILGIVPENGDRLRIDPALPADWPGFTATVTLAGRTRRIEVTRDRVTLDGAGPADDGTFAL